MHHAGDAGQIYGRDPKTGFARSRSTIIGLQYGLVALNSGAITVDEFLELNEKIGGNDIDGGFVEKRSTGTPSRCARSTKRAHEFGGGGLANVRYCTIDPTPMQQATFTTASGT
jgi:hypothetical protein